MLVDASKAAGAYTAIWDASDDRWSRVTSGVYFVRVSQGGHVGSDKLVLLK